MWLPGAPNEACGVLRLLRCPRFLRRATFPTSEASYYPYAPLSIVKHVTIALTPANHRNSWFHQFLSYSITGLYKPTVSVVWSSK